MQVYAAAGTVQNNYVNILWMLLRLRQACDHPMLVKKCHKTEAFHKTTLEAVRKLPPPQRAELVQCLEGGRTICHICQVFCEHVQCSGAWGFSGRFCGWCCLEDLKSRDVVGRGSEE